MYIPPNSPNLHYKDYLTLLKRYDPAFILGNLNVRHFLLGHTDNNLVGRNLTTVMNQDHYRNIGPQFPTLMRHNNTTSPNTTITNNQAFHNCRLQAGPITFSDPIIATISCNPIEIPINPRRQIKKVD